MITLCLDTSFKYLVVTIIKDDEIIDSFCELCEKKQSEFLITKVDELCKRNNIKPLDINKVVITKGPGSYTGVRIAMSMAKVMCSTANIPLYTINTLELMSTENSLVLMDARSKRAYYAVYKNGVCTSIGVDEIDYIKSLYDDSLEIIGDASLLGKEDNYPNLSNCFLNKKDQWELVDNVHTLVPLYLKDADAYMVKK